MALIHETEKFYNRKEIDILLKSAWELDCKAPKRGFPLVVHFPHHTFKEVTVTFVNVDYYRVYSTRKTTTDTPDYTL